ncbi:unnamed protein product [Symbiodinium natans]|uniref:Uncharacterized protein n=1 Tax=Symbiodinium natans TaxID=878477 RepID=A0A812G8W2_9DINO|nr:unnamed protein product [Symbiodinium natans]
MNNFDAQKWYQKVDKLVSTLQSKSEWETISALREGYSFKDSERAADLVHVEALADLNDEELRNYEHTKEKLETQVEAKQLEILAALTTFSESLKKTTREVIQRRRARRRVKKKFSFSNMDEVRFVVKDGEEEVAENNNPAANIQTSSAEVDSIKGHRAGELLTQISGLQNNMNELVRDAHLHKQTLEVHEKALSFLEGAMEAAEKGEDAPEADKDIQELLHKMQTEAKATLDAERRHAATERANLASVCLEDALFAIFWWSVHLTQFENDVEMLQKKVQARTSAVVSNFRPMDGTLLPLLGTSVASPGRDRSPSPGVGTDTYNEQCSDALVAQQNSTADGSSEVPAKDAEVIPTSLISPPGAVDPRRRLLSGDVPPPSKLVAALEMQVPAAKQAKEFKEKFSIDMKALRRSFLAAQDLWDTVAVAQRDMAMTSEEAAETEGPPSPAATDMLGFLAFR